MSLSPHCCFNCEERDLREEYGDTWFFHRLFVVCRVCGNKRCPKATDHNLDCTGSNESGQKGSKFE